MEQNHTGFRPRPPFPPRRPCRGGPAPGGDSGRRRDAPGQDQRQGEIIILIMVYKGCMNFETRGIPYFSQSSDSFYP